MKRLLVALSVSAALIMGSSLIAFSQDGASLYKACQGCHGAQGEKLAMGVGAPLKGQSAEDLSKKMHGYKDGSYGHAKKAVMENLMKRFDDAQIQVLSDHISKF
ncbi:MAG: c-type cytochrome [Halodesulfovibrio sp.]